MRKILRQLEEAVDDLERKIFRLNPDEEDWLLFFQLLRSFRQFDISSYRETLLLAIVPTYLLETPYSVEEYVDPPRAHCFKKADFLYYSQPEWLGLSGTRLTDRLSQNEFGYLHPSDSKSFLGITQRIYNRLYALYCRCPEACRAEADLILLAMSDFILDVALDGNQGKLSDYLQ